MNAATPDTLPTARHPSTPRALTSIDPMGMPRRRRGVAGLAMAAALLTITAASSDAQRVLGPWEDATIAPRGMIRAGIGVDFGHWSERLARRGGAREPLGADFTIDSLGPKVLPGMMALSPLLATVSGLTDPPLSLGSLRTTLDVTQATTPMSIELGLTGRVALEAVIPYVKNRVHVTAIANAAGPGATLGLNPAWFFPGARQQNALVVTSLGAAASSLSAELARCATSTDASCAAINADRAGATGLVSLANQVADAVAAVYGTPSLAGSAYAPLAGSAVHLAVDARLAAIGSQMKAFLGAAPSGDWVAARPVPASLLAAADLATLLSDSAYGIVARPLSDYEHSHLGDIAIGAKILLLDTFGPGATSASRPARGALRLAVAGLVTLPTGQVDLPYDFTDVGTGDHLSDLEVRGFADLALGGRLWASAVVRYGMQRAGEATRRIPTHAADVFPELATEQIVTRDPGDFLEAEIAPRYLPNDAFSVSALYRYRTRGADTYHGSFAATSIDGSPLALDASLLGSGTSEREHLFGMALTFSSVRGYALREARWPLEVSLVHTEVIGGRGVARLRTIGVNLRLYRTAGRANPLRPGPRR